MMLLAVDLMHTLCVHSEHDNIQPHCSPNSKPVNCLCRPVQPTCADNSTDAGLTPHPCPAGTVPNSANANSTTIDDATCCMASAYWFTSVQRNSDSMQDDVITTNMLF
jgi:hypothetical protein